MRAVTYTIKDPHYLSAVQTPRPCNPRNPNPMKIPASAFSLSKSGLYLIAKQTRVNDGVVTQDKCFVSKEEEPDVFDAILKAQAKSS